jgi:hypothetical protein
VVTDTKTKKSRKFKIALIAVCAVVVFAALYAGAIVAYRRDTSARMVVLDPRPPHTQDYVSMLVKTRTVDINGGSIDMRVIFIPNGKFLNADDELTEDLHFIATTSTGGVERVLPKGQFPSPADVTVELAGTASDYPWDRHTGGLAIAISGPKVNGRNQYVPIQVSFSGDIPGIDIGAKLMKEAGVDFNELALVVQRSPVTKVVVVFSMVILWLLTATVLTMVIAELLGHKVEMVLFPFIAAVLFSMVAFRNALPGSPPIGALSDYLAFFWGWTLCVLALLVLMIAWVKRLPPRESRSPKT